MCAQTAAVRRLGQMSTTYLTSTFAGLLAALASRRRPPDWQRSAGVLLAMAVGAVGGALAATMSPDWVPVAILLPLTAVLVTARAASSCPHEG
jgi:uncharacterized membrane protein YoaK (UPF0700 family)